MALYNLMTHEGFDGWMPWTLCWFSLIFIVFIALIIRRQTEDGILAGTNWNFYGSITLGLVGNIILASLFGDARWSLVAGIVGIFVGGYLIGLIWDTSREGGDDYG